MTRPLIKDALVQTAARIDAGGSFRESLVEDALEEALGEHFGSDQVAACGRKRFQIPDWDPCPLGIDMVVRHGCGLRFVFELKVDDVDQTLWDIYKMLAVLSMLQSNPVEAAFVVVAARLGTWTQGRLNCTELYPAESGQPQRWSTRTVFEAARKSWHHELAHGSGRPLRVPNAILVDHIAAIPVSSRPGYELRAIELRPADKRWLTCTGGWPDGVTPFRCDRTGCRACRI